MIEAIDLHKSFKLYHQPSDRLKELFLRRPYHKHHAALNGISFKVHPGEILGILGRNGAGKSTLLKILNGVLLPDSGQVVANGRVTGLLELGTGFDPTLNGLQNIRTNGLLLGMTEAEISDQTPGIIDFAELGPYIEEPLRTYSSGMTMRLAFAIAIHANPQTFLIDEALSVGDGYFQQKCIRRIREFREGGGSIIFVSHDLNAVKMVCDRVLVLSNGRIVADDNPEDAVNLYNQLLSGNTDDLPGAASADTGFGSFAASILSARLTGLDSLAAMVTSGESVELEVVIEGHQDIEELTLGMVMRDRFGQDMFGTNTHVLEAPFSIRQGEIRHLKFSFAMHLRPGKYTVTLALHDGIDHTKDCYHWWDKACQFEVAGIRGAIFTGVCNLLPSVAISTPPEPRATLVKNLLP